MFQLSRILFDKKHLKKNILLMIYYVSTNFQLITMLMIAKKRGHIEDIDFELKHNYVYKIIMLHKIKL